MGKIKPKPRKSPPKASTAQAASGAKRKLVKREVQPAYTKGMKVRVTPEIARAAILKVMQAEKGVPGDR